MTLSFKHEEQQVWQSNLRIYDFFSSVTSVVYILFLYAALERRIPYSVLFMLLILTTCGIAATTRFFDTLFTNNWNLYKTVVNLGFLGLNNPFLAFGFYPFCTILALRLFVIATRSGKEKRHFAIICFITTIVFASHTLGSVLWWISDGRLDIFLLRSLMEDVFIKFPLPLVTSLLLSIRTADMTLRLERQSEILEEQVRERTRELQTANEEISRQMEVQAEQAREIELANTALQQAHEESETLLLNILPAPIAHRLKSGERAIADKFDAVTVLFADIVGFTKLSARTTPEELVQGLNAIFERFDGLAKKYNLEKIKTIGDAYMVAGGLPERTDDHCERVAMFALEIQAVMLEEALRTSAGERVQLCIGIHTGEAVAGVIGTSKFAYDLWGDTVNTASRMESHGEAGKIHCSNEVYEALKEKFVFEERGEIEVKGKGLMRTWFLTKIRSEVPKRSAEKN
jgi:class 3 adenylate cyclase